MASIYYVFPPFDSAEVAIGPEAAELGTLPGNFMTPFAYEIVSAPGVTFRWSRKVDGIRFATFTDEGEAFFLKFFKEKLAPRGATLVKGRR